MGTSFGWLTLDGKDGERANKAIERLLDHTDRCNHSQAVHPHNDVEFLKAYIRYLEQDFPTNLTEDMDKIQVELRGYLGFSLSKPAILYILEKNPTVRHHLQAYGPDAGVIDEIVDAISAHLLSTPYPRWGNKVDPEEFTRDLRMMAICKGWYGE